MITHKKPLATVFGMLILIALVDGALPRATLSANDLHVAWLLAGSRFFVPVENASARPGAMRTAPELARLDNGVDEFFAKKSSGTFRVFCLGGSTTRGWPFHPAVSYPRLLSRQLADVLPGIKIEVINAGFMGHDSWSDVPLVRELIGYEPDLLLLYEGRNELCNFPLHDGSRGALLKAHAWLSRRVRFYDWLRKCLALTLAREPDQAKSIRVWAARGSSTDEPRVRRALTENLDRMREAASAAKVPIVLLTQVTSSEEVAGTDDSHMRRLNGWLKEYGTRHAVPVIDVDVAIDEAKRRELVIPYPIVHPDVRGYCLMARIIGRELTLRNLLGPGLRRREDRLRTDDEYLWMLGLSAPLLARTYCKVGRLFRLMELPKLAARYRSRAENSVSSVLGIEECR